MRPSRRHLLGGALATGLIGLRRAGAATSARRLILVVADGAWDPTFVFDARRGVGDGPFPDEVDGAVEDERSYGEITVSTNLARRPSVTSFFEQWGHRTAVVNGLWTGTLSHWAGMLRVLTGTSDPAAPDLVALVGADRGVGAPLPALDAGGMGRPGPHSLTTVRTGVRGQLAAMVDPSVRYPMADGGDRPEAGLGEADEAAIDRFLAARGSERGAARSAARRVREASDELVPFLSGRRNTLGEDLRMAAELCSSGAAHAALVDSGQPWDTHADAARQHSCWDDTFAALGGLATGLQSRGVLDETLVVVLSDLGRTPWRNAQGGTDHWPYTSAVLFGADVRGGTLLGGTDDGFVGRTADPSTGRPSRAAPDPLLVTNLTAGVLEAVGVEGALPGVAPLRGFRD